MQPTSVLVSDAHDRALSVLCACRVYQEMSMHCDTCPFHEYRVFWHSYVAPPFQSSLPIDRPSISALAEWRNVVCSRCSPLNILAAWTTSSPMKKHRIGARIFVSDTRGQPTGRVCQEAASVSKVRVTEPRPSTSCSGRCQGTSSVCTFS